MKLLIFPAILILLVTVGCEKFESSQLDLGNIDGYWIPETTVTASRDDLNTQCSIIVQKPGGEKEYPVGYVIRNREIASVFFDPKKSNLAPEYYASVGSDGVIVPYENFDEKLVSFQPAGRQGFINLIVESQKEPILMQEVELEKVKAIEKIARDCN